MDYSSDYRSWGVHAVIDAGECDLELISSRENIHAFTIDLVKRIDMVAYGEPQIEWFAGHDPDKAGFTLVQLIETSAICAHFVEGRRELYLDVFSCKDFNIETVIECVEQYFGAKRVQHMTLDRGVSYSVPAGRVSCLGWEEDV